MEVLKLNTFKLIPIKLNFTTKGIKNRITAEMIKELMGFLKLK